MAQPGKITKYIHLENRLLANYNNFTKREKPNSSVYNICLNKKKLNNILNKAPNSNTKSNRQRKIPLYNNPFYSPRKIEKRTNYKALYRKSQIYKNKKKKSLNSFEKNHSSFSISTKKESLNTLLNNNSIHPDIYIKKNNISISHHRCTSEGHVNNLKKVKMETHI